MLLAVSKDIRSVATVCVSCICNPVVIHTPSYIQPIVLGLPLWALLCFLPLVILTKAYSYLSALQVYAFGHTNPLVLSLLFPLLSCILVTVCASTNKLELELELVTHTGLRIDNKQRTSALRSTRTRDLGRHFDRVRKRT